MDVSFRQITTDNAFLKYRVMHLEDRVRVLQRRQQPIQDSTPIAYDLEPSHKDRIRTLEARQRLLMADYYYRQRTLLKEDLFSMGPEPEEVKRVE
jgi:hypothetical protein